MIDAPPTPMLPRFCTRYLPLVIGKRAGGDGGDHPYLQSRPPGLGSDRMFMSVQVMRLVAHWVTRCRDSVQCPELLNSEGSPHVLDAS